MSYREMKRNWSGALLAIGLVLSGTAGAAPGDEDESSANVTQVNFAGDGAYTGPYGLTTTGTLTAAGSTVVNDASLTYAVGTVTQEGIAASDEGNQATFLVDRILDVNVTRKGGLKTGAGTDAYLTFDVRNESNDTIDLLLRLSQISADLEGTLTNEITGATVEQVFLDDGTSNGTYDAGEQLAHEDVTATDRVYLLSAAEAAPGDVVTVHVQLNLGSTAAFNDWATYALSASLASTTSLATDTAVAAAGAEITSEDADTATPEDDPLAVEDVFGDGGGTDDAVRDGKHSARDQIKLVTADPTISKSSEVIYDPIVGLKYDLTEGTDASSNPYAILDDSGAPQADPHAIPGAIVRYTIRVANDGTNADRKAESVSVSDEIANTLAKIGSGNSSLPTTCTGVAVGVAGGGTCQDTLVPATVFDNAVVTQCGSTTAEAIPLPSNLPDTLTANIGDCEVNTGPGDQEGFVVFYLTIP